VFAGKKLHECPGARERIASGDSRYLNDFAQEVRRTAPFFPVIGGRARHSLQWNGYAIAKGDWVLLDLYGTDHHPDIWPRPHAFDPDRFQTMRPTAFELIPQGAGDASVTHRCPGEDMTLALIRTAVQQLTSVMDYEVPEQDLSVCKSTIPALPRSGLILGSVRRNPVGSSSSLQPRPEPSLPRPVQSQNATRSTMATPQELETKFWKALKSDMTMMLGLAGKDDGHTRPMTAQIESERGPIWFFAATDTALVRQLGQGSRAIAAFASKGHDLFATVHGHLRIDNDRAVIDRLWNRYVAAWYEHGKQDPKLALLRLDPDKAEIWIDASSLTAGIRLLLGADPKEEYKDKVAKVDLR
jgi:general stress protein 26